MQGVNERPLQSWQSRGRRGGSQFEISDKSGCFCCSSWLIVCRVASFIHSRCLCWMLLMHPVCVSCSGDEGLMCHFPSLCSIQSLSDASAAIWAAGIGQRPCFGFLTCLCTARRIIQSRWDNVCTARSDTRWYQGVYFKFIVSALQNVLVSFSLFWCYSCTFIVLASRWCVKYSHNKCIFLHTELNCQTKSKSRPEKVLKVTAQTHFPDIVS